MVKLADGSEHKVRTTGVTIYDVGAVLDLGDGRQAFIPSAGLVSVIDAPREAEAPAEAAAREPDPWLPQTAEPGPAAGYSEPVR